MAGIFPGHFVWCIRRRFASRNSCVEFPYLSVSSFFILFVDGMFTTFIRELFTNATEPIVRGHAVHCV